MHDHQMLQIDIYQLACRMYNVYSLGAGDRFHSRRDSGADYYHTLQTQVLFNAGFMLVHLYDIGPVLKQHVL